MYIKISVNNKIATLQDNVQIINGNSDYVIKFDFDSEWDAYETKTARFVTDTGYTDVVFSGDEVAVPVITDAISVRVGVYAGNLHTTTPAVIFCRRSITDGSGSPADPTPDVYAQLMEMLNKDSGIWYPTVDDAGNMSWTRSITETEPAPINIKGPKGDKGDKGDTGAQGAQGEQGIQGIQGIQGVKGDKGDKGDTGATGAQGPKGDTGPQGPAGAPGKDGAGMNITGATVGQIAKIAAVDDSGKPTAWEPVDMPSGGGGDGGAGAKEFRLIQSITLDEQSDRVDISVDSNGNAFALHEVYVKLAAQSYGNAENVTFLPNGRWTSGDAYITSSNKSSSSSDNWKNSMIFHAVYADGVICSEQLPTKGQNNNLTSSFAAGQSIISKISIVAKFAAGCTFLVIGR